MKIYTLLSIALLIISLGSCTNKQSDSPINDNNPTGDYSYVSNSKYHTDNNSEPISAVSDGLMYVTWYIESTSINITVNPNIGYSYNLTCTNLETHNDTTTFRLNSQVINLNGTEYKIVGNNDVYLPHLGNFDGFFVKDKKIVYSFKSFNSDSFETTYTFTEGNKINY